MGRSTLHLIQDQDQHQPGFKTWWHSLEGRWRTLRFFREERNALLKERLIAVHGLGYSDVAVRFRVRAEGEEVPPSEPPPPLDPAPLLTTRLAFFDAPGWDDRPAVEFIADYLTDLEAVTSEAEAQF
jgi:hypothetical protein